MQSWKNHASTVIRSDYEGLKILPGENLLLAALQSSAKSDLLQYIQRKSNGTLRKLASGSFATLFDGAPGRVLKVVFFTQDADSPMHSNVSYLGTFLDRDYDPPSLLTYNEANAELEFQIAASDTIFNASSLCSEYRLCPRLFASYSSTDLSNENCGCLIMDLEKMDVSLSEDLDMLRQQTDSFNAAVMALSLAVFQIGSSMLRFGIVNTDLQATNMMRKTTDSCSYRCVDFGSQFLYGSKEALPLISPRNDLHKYVSSRIRCFYGTSPLLQSDCDAIVRWTGFFAMLSRLVPDLFRIFHSGPDTTAETVNQDISSGKQLFRLTNSAEAKFFQIDANIVSSEKHPAYHFNMFTSKHNICALMQQLAMTRRSLVSSDFWHEVTMALLFVTRVPWDPESSARIDQTADMISPYFMAQRYFDPDVVRLIDPQLLSENRVPVEYNLSKIKLEEKRRQKSPQFLGSAATEYRRQTIDHESAFQGDSPCLLAMGLA